MARCIYRVTDPTLGDGCCDASYGSQHPVALGSAWVYDSLAEAERFARECERAWRTNPPGFADEEERKAYYAAIKPYTLEPYTIAEACEALAGCPDALEALGLDIRCDEDEDEPYCQCGEILGEACAAEPEPGKERVRIQYVLEADRGTASTLGSATGLWQEILVDPECAELLLEDDDPWIRRAPSPAAERAERDAEHAAQVLASLESVRRGR